MKIYHYHPITGEFMGQGLADPDPMTLGKYLIPAHATTVSPPQPAAGFALVFAGGSWSHVADRRGEVWFDEDGAAVTIDSLGNPADDGLSSVEPTPAPIDPLTLPLSAAEFEAALALMGVDREQIESAIMQAVTDQTARAVALGRWRRLVSIERSNAIMALLTPVFGVTDSQIDGAWRAMIATRAG